MGSAAAARAAVVPTAQPAVAPAAGSGLRARLVRRVVTTTTRIRRSTCARPVMRSLADAIA
jgi:hypothetical protein